MAEIVGAFVVPHDPMIFSTPDAPSPIVSARVHGAYAEIARRIEVLQADVAIIIGADHYINFGPGCLPRYLIGIGDVAGPIESLPGIERGAMKAHAALASHIAHVGFAEGFDWAVAKVLNVDHSVGLPARVCLPSHVAVIPVYLASGAEPLLGMRRAHELGGSMRRAVESWPGNERVIVMGSGGISHWVGMPEQGRVNPQFDRLVLDCLARGDAESLMGLSDADVIEQGGNGALEIRNFVCAMALLPGARGEVVAYEPVPEWITGLGFVELRA